MSNIQQGMSNVQVVEKLEIVRKKERNSHRQHKSPSRAALNLDIGY
jgi:hypothetical protein